MKLIKELVELNEALDRLPPVKLIYNLLFQLNADIQEDDDSNEALIPMGDDPASLDANAYQIFAEYEDNDSYTVTKAQAKKLAKELADYVKKNNLESWPGQHTEKSKPKSKFSIH